MTITEICKDLISQSGFQQKDVAERLGWTQQSISNKFKRNSLSAEDFKKIIETLGFKMKFVKDDTCEEIKARRKGVGDRLQMMVNGVKYDTYKADAICHSDTEEDIFYELYQDLDGNYFVAQYVNWEGGVNSISPIGEQDAKRLIKRLS